MNKFVMISLLTVVACPLVPTGLDTPLILYYMDVKQDVTMLVSLDVTNLVVNWLIWLCKG